MTLISKKHARFVAEADIYTSLSAIQRLLDQWQKEKLLNV